MAVDLTAKSVDALTTILKNHESAGKTDAPSFKAALAELGKRTKAGLSLDRTVEIIIAAAKAGHFITYKTVATESGVKWNSANVTMPKHLLAVSEHGHRKGWPMLSAIVMTQSHQADGLMDPSTLEGFTKAAITLGHEVIDPVQFLKDQQAAVFAAAKAGKLG